MKEKILITGDTGLLGANISFLWRDIYDVVGVSRGTKSVIGIKHISTDLSDSENVEKLILEELPTVIIHTAALVSVEECEQNPEKAVLFNVNMVENLVSSAKKIGAYFVQISTDAFYERKDDKLCDEKQELKLNNVYAKTKYEGELKALSYNNSLCLRTNMYGFNFLQEKFSFGEWILRDLKDDKNLTMFTDVLFSPILVNDLVEVLRLSIEKRLKGLYNAGGTGSISKYDFAVYIKELSKIETGKIIPISVKDFPFTAWRSTNMSMNNEKLKKTLSFEMPEVKRGIENFSRLVLSDYPKLLREM